MKLAVAVFAAVAAAGWDRGGGDGCTEATWQGALAGAPEDCRYTSDCPVGDTQKSMVQPPGNSLFSHLAWNSEHFSVFAPQSLSSDRVGGGPRGEKCRQLSNGASCGLSPASVCRGTYNQQHTPTHLYDSPLVQTEDMCVLTDIRQYLRSAFTCLLTGSTSQHWFSHMKEPTCETMDKEECRQNLTNADRWDHTQCRSISSSLPRQNRPAALTHFLISTELMCSHRLSNLQLCGSERKGTAMDSVSIAEEADFRGLRSEDEAWLEVTATNCWEYVPLASCFSKSVENLYSDFLLNCGLQTTLSTCDDSRVVWESVWLLGDSLDVEQDTWRLVASELSMVGSILSALGLLLLCAQEAALPAVSLTPAPSCSPPVAVPLRKVRKPKSLSVEPVSHGSKTPPSTAAPTPPARKDDCEKRIERSSTAATEEETEYLDDYKTRPGLFGGFSYID